MNKIGSFFYKLGAIVMIVVLILLIGKAIIMAGNDIPNIIHK